MSKKLKVVKDKKNDDSAFAIVYGGKYDNCIITLEENENKQKELIVENLLDHISEKKVRSKKKYMSLKELLKIKNSFESGNINDDIKDIYNDLRPEVENDLNKHVHIYDGGIQVIPLLKENQYDRIMVSGQSGSGKSYWCGQYGQQYNKLYPKNNIYVFSKIEEDEALDKLKNIKRIKLSDELLDIDFDQSELSNSLIIFDDIDTINNKKLCDKVKRMRDDLLECSRHYGISMLCISHQLLNFKSTKTLLLECNKIVFFPLSGGYQIRRFLKEYCSFDQQQIKTIMNIKSRWICINKTYPNTIIGENDVYIM